MSTTVTTTAEIPPAPYYVLSNDTFMSGWGHAEGKTNTVILPCESADEAKIVADNARARSDQKRVRIVTRKPRLQAGHLYSLMDRHEASRWYEPGYFSRAG